MAGPRGAHRRGPLGRGPRPSPADAPTPLLHAAELVREAAGSDAEIERPGGELPPGEGLSLPGGRQVARLAFPGRPIAAAIADYVAWLRAHPAAQSRARALSSSPTAWTAAAGTGSRCRSRRPRRRRRGGRAAIAAVRGCGAARLTAEAPVAWPSGAFVRVDRLDDEARAGIERSAEFAAGVGSPVLTIHLFIPLDSREYRAHGGDRRGGRARVPAFYAEACAARCHAADRERAAVLRMRTGGVFLSPVGGHWRDLLDWRERVPELGFTLDTSHAALFRSFAAAYPSLFGLAVRRGARARALRRGARAGAEVAHVSDAHGLLGEGLNYGSGELDLDPVVRRLGELVPFIVAEINEPDPARSPNMKAGYRAHRARARGSPPRRRRPPPRRLPATTSTGRPCSAAATRCPSVLELQERFGGRRVLITGGGGSIGGAARDAAARLPPEQRHAAGLARGVADRRPPRARPASLDRTRARALRRPRRRPRSRRSSRRARPDVVFHLAAYKHVDWAERFPEEFVDTNLHGSWNVLRAAEAAGVETVVVASTDKAALAASFYGRTKRFMEQLAASRRASAAAQRLRRAARQRARQRRQRLGAVPAPGARRRAADRHRHRDGPLLDHAGARRAALARPRRAAGRRGRAL